MIFESRKKAQITVQFNWIFILVAGAVILGFFTMMAVRQKSSATVAINARVKENLASIFEGARLGSGTSSLIRTSDIEINFICEDSGYSVYEVSGLTTQISSDVTFAPMELKGQNLVTWSYNWNLPYSIMNFLFISSTQSRYIFLYDEGNAGSVVLKEYINDTIPNHFTADYYTDIGDIYNLNDMNTRVIYLSMGVQANDLAFLREEFLDKGNKVSAISIIPFFSDAPYENGELRFYEEEIIDSGSNAFAESYYLGSASLFGAVFSDTKEYYDCNMRKAFRRLNYINNVFWEKIIDMQVYYHTIEHDPACSSVYSAARNIFRDINESSYEIMNSGDYMDEYANMISYAESLKDQNQEAQIKSCDVIY